MQEIRRIGILTGGGDAPGLNSVIESCSRVLLRAGVQVVGIRDGFDGLFARETLQIREPLWGLHARSGTLLGTSNRSRVQGREKEFLESYRKLQLDGLIVCGGDGTFKTLDGFRKDIPLIGIPKTIDNDLSGTDVTFGFDTACSVVAESVDELRFTAEAHQRIFIIEAMGRNAGWIALGGGLASLADAILIPERSYDPQKLCEFMRAKKNHQRAFLIVLAEGVLKEGESSEKMARWLERQTDWEARHLVLGHLQRSRAPTTRDRTLTLSLGVLAADLALDENWQKAVVFRGGEVQIVPVEDLMGPQRKVPADHPWISYAQELGIFI